MALGTFVFHFIDSYRSFQNHWLSGSPYPHSSLRSPAPLVPSPSWRLWPYTDSWAFSQPPALNVEARSLTHKRRRGGLDSLELCSHCHILGRGCQHHGRDVLGTSQLGMCPEKLYIELKTLRIGAIVIWTSMWFRSPRIK